MFNLSDYDFDLPSDLIAQDPPAVRGASRLMVVHVRDGRIEHRHFSDLPEILKSAYPGRAFDIIANRSKVIPARLLGRRQLRGENGAAELGGKVEVFLTKEVDGAWEVLLKMSKPPKADKPVEVVFESGLKAEVLLRDGRYLATFDGDPLAQEGRVPLPPYVTRDPRPEDRDRYQTVFAKEAGSVAAPTAGLHITEAMREVLNTPPFRWCEIVLHVGVGTFKPIQADDIRQHAMHAETFELPPETEAAFQRSSDRLRVCIGTTSMRALESYRAGRVGVTDIFIHPGNPPKHVDALVTNFHWPKSTLFVLVCTLGGHGLMRRAYEQAVAERYRFASYGDAMAIVK